MDMSAKGRVDEKEKEERSRGLGEIIKNNKRKTKDKGQIEDAPCTIAELAWATLFPFSIISVMQTASFMFLKFLLVPRLLKI